MKQQLAQITIQTPEQVADALLRGSHEMSQFPELFQGIPAKTKHTIQSIIDRVKVLQLETRKLQARLDHCMMRRSETQQELED